MVLKYSPFIFLVSSFLLGSIWATLKSNLFQPDHHQKLFIKMLDNKEKSKSKTKVNVFSVILYHRWSLKSKKHINMSIYSVQLSSVAQSCPTICDPMNCSTPGLPVHHHLPEFTQSHVHRRHPAISFSVIPFSSCPQSLPASKSFPMSQLFAWGGQSTGVSALASFFPKKS